MVQRIVILEDSSKSGFGGGQRVTLAVMEALKDNFQLTLCDTKNPTLFKEYAGNYLDSFIPIRTFGKIANKAVSSFNLSLVEILVSPFQFISNLVRLRKALRAYDGEKLVFYATTKKGLILAYFLHRLGGYSYCYHVHSAGEGGIFFSLMKPMYKHAGRIICVSEYVRKGINLPRAVTVYNPVPSIPDGRIREISGKIMVAVFAKLLQWKGINYFLDSFPYLKHQEKVQYLVYGDGPEGINLQSYASDRIFLKGFSKEPLQEMENIDIVVVPSVAPESFGMTIIEAYSKGIPVIVTNIGGQSEIVKDGISGIHVPIRNSKVIAEAIDYLIDHPEVYRRYSENARDLSRNFDLEHFFKRIQEIFVEWQ
jgi:glycosyltransferase involved in cell wall biosynthesis